MAGIDWLVLSGTLIFIVAYGVIKTRKFNSLKDHLKGGNSSNWWTIGLSVMATQASAITFLSTPGQAFHDGMGFVQFYFGLPLAMIVICMVFIPIYHKLKVYTAYEFLEQRFDLKTRTLAALLFLIQRGLAAGITIFAPAIILSTILGWDLKLLNVTIGVLVIIYTVSGGTKAVSITQKQQMFVIMSGMFIAFFIILNSLPEDINFSNAIDIAGIGGKMKVLDFSFDINERYTFWSGITGGLFLALSYFGTDQSQVQRYLSGKSIRESQLGLMFNAVLKIPMQFFILLVGVMVFVFFEFNQAPINFNPQVVEYLEQSKDPYYLTQKENYVKIKNDKKELQYSYVKSKNTGNNTLEIKNKIIELQILEKNSRENIKEIITQKNSDLETNDKDYVFIYFILNYLPKGIIGLLLAVILSAAMSSTASELNALSTTTVIDLYKRNHNKNKSETHYLKASKWFTIMWGIIAIIFASFGTLFENLIQLVNLIGSIFYGTILGIFLVAFFIKKVKGNAVFYSACISQTFIFLIYALTTVGYLWLNFIGAFFTIISAIIIQKMMRKD
ncbi:MAG: sodium:solute symporter [Bacteroidetes bacterium]|jgi:solute:Na+ symporter, SSS family|nr:MAG: sodium:solute symporter [Cryomorphaceae bacterium BACL29 MAG-121220-bin8]MDA0758205.1 sodium:solute symporter [Bacteroidota bacterium]MDA1019402.1 sodium:solute symporter [Bacteroidota bacterium]|tara:strand:- start:3819 stop:5495 length:1677 start_codon:yes stop_codon:yes gene_type:complete